MKKITFSKLPNGRWGVRGPAEVLKLGARVDVSLKDGTTETVTVKAIIWTRGEVSLAAVEHDPWR